MTIVEIIPAPRDWVVFFYHNRDDNSVSPWHWQPLAYMAQCADEDGAQFVAPLIDDSRGLMLPSPATEFCICHPVMARAWLDDESDIVEREMLEEYLSEVGQ